MTDRLSLSLVKVHILKSLCTITQLITTRNFKKVQREYGTLPALCASWLQSVEDHSG